MQKHLLWAAIVLALGACSTRPPPTLYTMVVPETHASAQLGKPVGILSVKLPPYLDRDELISRQGQNSLKLHEDDRWAEPLADTTARVMAQTLGQSLGARVITTRQSSTLESAPQITVLLSKFEADEQNLVSLKGAWRVSGKDTSPLFGVLETEAQAENASAAAIVAAMNQAAMQAAQQMGQGVAPIVRGYLR